MRDLPLTESRQKLVEDNISYAEALTRKIFAQHARFLDVDDMLCEAFSGLCVAAQRYDETSNIKFTTYAYFYIFKFVVEYVKRESKKLYGSVCIKNKNVVVCGIDTVDKFIFDTDGIDICEWDSILKELNYEERCVFAYKVAGYTKAQINKETGISLQKVNLYLNNIKTVIAKKLDREDLMPDNIKVEEVIEPQKKKRGRPKKVTLEVVQTAAQTQNDINKQSDIQPVHNDIVNTENSIQEVEVKHCVPDFLLNYDIQHNVGDTVYVAMFCGESEVKQLSLIKEFKYRVKKTVITSVILKTDNQVCYTTSLSKKTRIEGDKVFKTEQSCLTVCNELNRKR